MGCIFSHDARKQPKQLNHQDSYGSTENRTVTDAPKQENQREIGKPAISLAKRDSVQKIVVHVDETESESDKSFQETEFSEPLVEISHKRVVALDFGTTGTFLSFITSDSSERKERKPHIFDISKDEITQQGTNKNIRFSFLRMYQDSEAMSKFLSLFAIETKLQQFEPTLALIGSPPDNGEVLPILAETKKTISSLLGHLLPSCKVEYISNTRATLIEHIYRHKGFQKDSHQSMLVIHCGGGFFSYESYNVQGDSIDSVEGNTCQFGSFDLIIWCMEYLYSLFVPQKKKKLTVENYPYFYKLFSLCEKQLPLFGSADGTENNQESVPIEILQEKIWTSFPGYQEVDEDSEASWETTFDIPLGIFNQYLRSQVQSTTVYRELVSIIKNKEFQAIILQGGTAILPQFKQLLIGGVNSPEPLPIWQSFNLIESSFEGLMLMGQKRIDDTLE